MHYPLYTVSCFHIRIYDIFICIYLSTDLFVVFLMILGGPASRSQQHQAQGGKKPWLDDDGKASALEPTLDRAPHYPHP